MNLLTHTPPEDRVRPLTELPNGLPVHYTPAAPDPLWRRALIRLGLAVIEHAQLLHSRGREITRADHIAWAVEEIGSLVFHRGHHGSREEAAMILNGEIPWEYVDPETKRRLIRDFPPHYFTGASQ